MGAFGELVAKSSSEAPDQKNPMESSDQACLDYSAITLGKKVLQETQHQQRIKPTTARQQTGKRERERETDRERKKFTY